MSQETVVKAAPNMLLMLKDISYFLKRSGYNNMSSLENIIKEAEDNLEGTSSKMLHELKSIHQFLKFNGYDKKLVESVIVEAEPANRAISEEDFDKIVKHFVETNYTNNEKYVLDSNNNSEIKNKYYKN